jgi:hypothetical protein
MSKCVTCTKDENDLLMDHFVRDREPERVTWYGDNHDHVAITFERKGQELRITFSPTLMCFFKFHSNIDQVCFEGRVPKLVVTRLKKKIDFGGRPNLKDYLKGL